MVKDTLTKMNTEAFDSANIETLRSNMCPRLYILTQTRDATMKGQGFHLGLLSSGATRGLSSATASVS
jgi:hypothetical protein